MAWIRTALMLVALAFGLGFSPQALANEAPMRTAETVKAAPPIYLSGRHLNPGLQDRLTRARPYRPVAGMALGLGLGVAGGVVGVGITAPLLILGLPLAVVTGTVGVATGAALGAWRFGGNAPFWWTAVGAGLGMGVAATIQVGLILAGVAAAATVVGLPIAVLLAGGAVAVGLIAMPLGANIAARIHQKRPVPRVLFREPSMALGDAQADAWGDDPWQDDPWADSPWEEGADPDAWGPDAWDSDPWSEPSPWEEPEKTWAEPASGWSGSQLGWSGSQL